MKKFLFMMVLTSQGVLAQSLYFPPLSGGQWDTLSPATLQWCDARIDSLYSYLAVKNTKSFVVLKNGKLVLEAYFGSYTADSVWYWASSSKSLASLITGIAQQKGYINIGNPVSSYLGNGWTNAPINKESLITVKHLLKMSSGLDDSPPLPCDNQDTAKSCLLYLVDPDQRWAYHTGAYRKVQDVVSQASGMSYNALTTGWVKNKIGMGGIWIDQVYYSKARDMARFGLLALNRGVWNGDTVLKDQAYFSAMVASSQTMNPAYGYLWWLNGKTSYITPGLQFSFSGPLIPNAPADMYCALGKNDQKIYVVPSQSLVVVRQGNSAGAPTFALSDFDDRLWDYINKLTCPVNTGLLTLEHPMQLTIYPNPAETELHVVSDARLVSVIAVGTPGAELSLPFSDHSIDLRQLPSGLHVLRLQFSSGQTAYRKIAVR